MYMCMSSSIHGHIHIHSWINASICTLYSCVIACVHDNIFHSSTDTSMQYCLLSCRHGPCIHLFIQACMHRYSSTCEHVPYGHVFGIIIVAQPENTHTNGCSNNCMVPQILVKIFGFWGKLYIYKKI